MSGKDVEHWRYVISVVSDEIEQIEQQRVHRHDGIGAGVHQDVTEIFKGKTLEYVLVTGSVDLLGAV